MTVLSLRTNHVEATRQVPTGWNFLSAKFSLTCSAFQFYVAFLFQLCDRREEFLCHEFIIIVPFCINDVKTCISLHIALCWATYWKYKYVHITLCARLHIGNTSMLDYVLKSLTLHMSLCLATYWRYKYVGLCVEIIEQCAVYPPLVGSEVMIGKVHHSMVGCS